MFSHTVFVPEVRQSPRCREGWGMAVAREVEPFAHASRMLSTGRGGQGGRGPGRARSWLRAASVTARSGGRGRGRAWVWLLPQRPLVPLARGP